VTVGFVLACLLSLSVMEQAASQLQNVSIEDAVEMIRTSQAWLVWICLLGFVAGVIGMAFAAHSATKIVERLHQATKILGDVVLDEMTHDDFMAGGDKLSRDVQEMISKIKDNQLRYLDASPLTRLPGNLAIEQVLKTRMDDGEKFALCYIDLDDFKAYNDKYGYAKGSDVIKMTGEVVYRTKDQHAAPGDFVGHIGGDDFVLVTSPDIVEIVCKSIISDFDRLIPDFYDDEDRDNGFIEGVDRYGVKRSFPVMSISIAVVSDVRRTFNSPVEIAKVATEIKDYVKSLPGSNYLIDRRISTRWDS
jgi:GGDEF domain-containing protein